MKLGAILTVGLIIAGLVSCECMRRQSTATAGPNHVKIDEHSILIPGNAISEDDRESVTNIFKKYDSSLYRITVYKKGKLKKHLGEMSEMQVGEVASEYSNHAAASGLTNWTMKIGNVTHVNQAGNPTHVTTEGRPTHVSKDSDVLVKEVTPILEKYSR